MLTWHGTADRLGNGESLPCSWEILLLPRQASQTSAVAKNRIQNPQDRTTKWLDRIQDPWIT